jgi:hypothetical protein
VIYFYLDRVVFVPSASYSQQALTDVSKLSVDPQKVSSDQKYYAKLQTTDVKFYTIDNIFKKELLLKAGESVSYFSWVPDTDLALIGISRNTVHGTSVSLKSVNLETNNYPVEPKISGLAPGSKIVEVASSSQVNVTYILIKSKITTLVYRTYANNSLRKVISHTAVRRIASLQSVDMLLYDNKQDGKVYALSNKGKWKMISPKVGNYALIGSDKDDNIYIGRLNGSGVISSILKGDPKGNFAQYKSLDYLYPVTSVTVNYDGKLQLT